MHRIAATWICLSICGTAFANPVGKPAPAEFGANGIVTDEQLAKLTFGPLQKDHALAVHLPNSAALEGEPLWAYFVVHNSSDRVLGLNMRFDFIVGDAAQHSCSINIKPLSEGAMVRGEIRGDFECFGPRMVDVQAKGYYVAALDVSTVYKLAPGEYEISWTHLSPGSSNAVRFRILPAQPGKKAVPRPLREWSAWQVNKESVDKWQSRDLAAGLGSGLGRRHVTDLERLRAEDDLVAVSAEWKFGKRTDRILLRFESKNPAKKIGIKNVRLYLIADHAGQAKFGGGMEELALTPRKDGTIELHVPSNWRAGFRADAPKTRAALLVATTPMEKPSRDRGVVMRDAKEAIPVWNGLLRTDFVEAPASNDKNPREGSRPIVQP